MRWLPSLTPWVLGIGSLLARSAHAEDQSVHATLATDVSATDNVFASPGGANKEADVYGQIRPGMLFNYLTPRATYEVFGEMEVLEYVRNSDAPSFTARTGLRTEFVTGPFSNLSFGANGSTGRLNAIGNRTSPDESVLTLSPPGAISVVQADVSQGFSYQAARTVQWFQGMSARYSRTTDPVPSMTPSGEAFGYSSRAEGAELGFATGLSKSFEDVRFGIDAGVTYLYLEGHSPIMDVRRLDKQVNPRAGANITYDIDRNWSAGLSGGVVYVIPIGTRSNDPMFVKRGTLVAPVVGGQVSYTDVWGTANLSASRTISPNLLIAQNAINDSVTGTVAMPLRFLEANAGGPPTWIGLGSIGAQRTQLIESSSTSAPQGEFYAFRLDLGVTYRMRPGMTLGGRYSISHQTGDSAAAVMAIPAFTQNTLTFTMTARYPERTAVRQKRNKRKSSNRADQSDMTPLDGMSPADGGDMPAPAE